MALPFQEEDLPAAIKVRLFVRIASGSGHHQNSARGRVIGRSGRNALVQVFGHPKPLLYDVQALSPWYAKNEENQIIWPPNSIGNVIQPTITLANAARDASPVVQESERPRSSVPSGMHVIPAALERAKVFTDVGLPKLPPLLGGGRLTVPSVNGTHDTPTATADTAQGSPTKLKPAIVAPTKKAIAMSSGIWVLYDTTAGLFWSAAPKHLAQWTDNIEAAKKYTNTADAHRAKTRLSQFGDWDMAGTAVMLQEEALELATRPHPRHDVAPVHADKPAPAASPVPAAQPDGFAALKALAAEKKKSESVRDGLKAEVVKIDRQITELSNRKAGVLETVHAAQAGIDGMEQQIAAMRDRVLKEFDEAQGAA